MIWSYKILFTLNWISKFNLRTGWRTSTAWSVVVSSQSLALWQKTAPRALRTWTGSSTMQIRTFRVGLIGSTRASRTLPLLRTAQSLFITLMERSRHTKLTPFLVLMRLSLLERPLSTCTTRNRNHSHSNTQHSSPLPVRLKQRFGSGPSQRTLSQRLRSMFCLKQSLSSSRTTKEHSPSLMEMQFRMEQKSPSLSLVPINSNPPLLSLPPSFFILTLLVKDVNN